MKNAPFFGFQIMALFLLIPLWPLSHIWFLGELYFWMKDSRIHHKIGVAAPFIVEAIAATPFFFLAASKTLILIIITSWILKWGFFSYAQMIAEARRLT